MAQLQNLPTSAPSLPDQIDPPSSILILDVSPQVDCGRYAVKREVGDVLEVWADIFKDGHDKISAHLEYWREGSDDFAVAEMSLYDNDRWHGFFYVGDPGRYRYRIVAFPDSIATKRDEIIKKFDAGIDVSLEIREFELILAEIAQTYPEAAEIIESIRHQLAHRTGDGPRVAVVTAVETVEALRPYRNIGGAMATPEYQLIVDRTAARYASWYEMFPRSAGTVLYHSGTFADVEARLPDIAGMGFDVLYFTPIHPIGTTNKKGKNNNLVSTPEDPGVPYAIGGPDGGHDAIEPQLGTIEDFDHLIETAAGYGIEIALDLAFQASPDHPWAQNHSDWFTIRPDGTIKFAENPPKKYEDIYPINFESEDWKALWLELLRIVQFWVDHGVRTFRVDNPHTKPIPFWEWLIAEVRKEHPEVIFLSEAFTRWAKMTRLAKAGFSQSYTYFTWQNSRWELTDLMERHLAASEFLRPNFFANTPDILHEDLQHGGPPAFATRLVLAATLSPSYGIYSGYEHFENVPVRDGSEEYLDSEKYEAKQRSLDGPLLPLVQRINAARRENPALQRLDNLMFLDTENEALIGYAKHAPGNLVVTVVNLDPHHAQEGIAVAPAALGTPPAFEVEDLLTGERYHWGIGRNYVRLDPGERAGHVLKVLA